MKIENKKNICNDPYRDFIFKTDYGTFTVSETNNHHPDDFGYVLFTVKQKGEPSDVETFFGLNRKQALQLAWTLLSLTWQPKKK
jgi:hypothetical protein